MSNKKKITTAVVAVATAAALLLGGTFAWQSINQTALNETSDVVNPGGRLHDDFNGENKDVYVENFAENEIFARIRLEEFFEITQAGGTVHSIAGTRDADGNVAEYAIHYFGSDNATDEYWDWQTGGSTVFMPTFNKNKDSLKADINGTYNGNDNHVTDEADDDRYTDYVEYTYGEPKTDEAVYDIDSNMDEDDGVEYVSETHTAKNTLGATLMSMQEWIDAGSQPGDYWVYDTDGWVYWAAPIAPGEATGLLLDGISLDEKMDDSWYYAINVIAQFVTADDVGISDRTGFYDTENGSLPSAEAEELLKIIGVTSVNGADSEESAKVLDVDNISVYSDSTVFLGSTGLVLKADYFDGENWVTLNVTDWSITDGNVYSEGTAFAADGTLSVDANETSSSIYVSGEVADGDYAGYVFDGAYVGITMPWLNVIETDVSGNEVNSNWLLGASTTKYYTVESVTVYGDDEIYLGYEAFTCSNDNIDWSLSGEYPMDAVDGTYSYEWTDDGKLLKVTHTCGADTCTCAWNLHIGAEYQGNTGVTGFINAYVYKSSEEVDTIHLYVGYTNAEGEYVHTICENGTTYNITARVSSYNPYIDFAVGECATGNLRWYNTDGTPIADESGLLASVDGIASLSPTGLTLDPDKKLDTLTLIGKYAAVNELDQEVSIEVTFNFEWIE